MAAAASDKHRSLLACCRPDAQPQGDRRMREALAHMAADPALKEAFTQQAEFDGRMAALVRGLPLPETFATEIDAGLRGEAKGAPASRWRALLREPALWAVLLAGAFLLAYTANAYYEHMTGFTGSDTVRELVESSRHGAHADHVEPINTECSQLGDKLFVQYGLEDYEVPAAFAHDQAISYRVFAKNDSLVAQVVVRDHDRPLTFLVFRADQQGVAIHPAGRWKFLKGDDWTAAVELHHQIGFAAVASGDDAGLREYLGKLEGGSWKAENPGSKP